jgi:hypothetical protein
LVSRNFVNNYLFAALEFDEARFRVSRKVKQYKRIDRESLQTGQQVSPLCGDSELASPRANWDRVKSDRALQAAFAGWRQKVTSSAAGTLLPIPNPPAGEFCERMTPLPLG